MKFTGRAGSAFGGVLLLAACSGGGGGVAAPTPSTASSSPADLGATLKEALDPISAGLGQAVEAKTTYDLTKAFGTVNSKAGRASRTVMEGAAPAAAEPARTELATALDTLDAEAAAINSDYFKKKLCTVGIGLARLRAGKGLAGVSAAVAKLRTAGIPVSFPVPQLPEAPPVPRALDNGTLVRDGGHDGTGTLELKNNSATDVVFTITADDKAVASVYAAKGKEAAIEGVKAGSYDFYYLGGEDWDSGEKQFSQDCRSVKFSEKYEFKPAGTIWTMTLGAKPGEGAPAKTESRSAASAPQP